VIRFFRDPVRRLLDLRDRYGGLAALGAGDASVVCAFGEGSNRLVLSDSARFSNFADLPVPVPKASAPTRLNSGLTNMNGEMHRQKRRLLMPLFAKSAVERYRDAMSLEIEQRLDRWRPGRSVDAVAEMTEITLAIALRCLFGMSPSAERESLGRLAVAFLGCIIDPLAMLLPVAIPGTPYRRLMTVSNSLEAQIRTLIAERRASGNGNDVLSLLVNAHDEEGRHLSDGELVGQTYVMFVAGFETTANTLAWTLFLLSQHPQHLREVGEEVEAILGERLPEVADLPRLRRLDAVVKESMRLLPAAPFLFMRRASDAFSLEGRELPPRTVLILSSLVAHRDPGVFPAPMEFRPERWETVAPGPYQYMPFGAGPRLCIGASFASQAIRLVLASLLRRAHPISQRGATVSRAVRGIVLGSRHGLPMRLSAPGECRTPQPVRGDIHELVYLPA
jgi:cytochrome P450